MRHAFLAACSGALFLSSCGAGEVAEVPSALARELGLSAVPAAAGQRHHWSVQAWKPPSPETRA